MSWDSQQSTQYLRQQLSQLKPLVKAPQPVLIGRLVRVVGLTMEAVGCRAPVGGRCQVETCDGLLDAEVIGFSGDILYLMPTDELRGVVPGARVFTSPEAGGVPVGMGLLGRVLDGAGNPIDGLGPVTSEALRPFVSPPLNPLIRKPVSQVMDVGVRAINGMLTVGKGQRMGLFAGSGVGKSVLLGMMTRGSEADVVVVGLIGERGREVKEFIEEILGPEGRKRAVVIAAAADTSPLMRLKGCETAHAIAEYFRDCGLNVLLLMDSLTRYAQAQREIALAVGEPPATKGYPPSVFAKLPQLVERAGNGGPEQGSVTAFYTVLSEGDDLQDPIADASRAILDGHIVLSRRLAESGHYPAIDIEQSISRVMPQIISDEHLNLARHVKQIYATYQQNQDLITIGAYKPGSDPEVDQSIRLIPAIRQVLQQSMRESIGFDSSVKRLQAVIRQG